jgi:hypothetical protein
MSAPAQQKTSTGAIPVKVFIECPKCEHQNRIEDLPVNWLDLALFRGSEEHVQCANCKAHMDTMTAYCGERIDSRIEKRPDPKRPPLLVRPAHPS